jgi:hypothetical protein
MTDETRRSMRQEKDRLPGGRILLVGSAALLISILLSIGSWILYDERRRALRPSGRFPEARIELEDEVQSVQRELLSSMGPGQRRNAEKRRELSSHGWVDRRRGIVSIPIEDAMQLVIEEQSR